MPTLTSYFNDMDDPRGGNAPRHKFCDLMTISLLCALCGGETAVDMELFGRMKEDFLREFLELPQGIPCHDAYSRLFRVMNPRRFRPVLYQGLFNLTDFRPVAACDGGDGLRSCDEIVPGLAPCVENRVICVERPVCEPCLAEILPNVFGWIQLW